VNKKEFIKIINEEIQEFDFLGNDEHSKEMETINLLKNEDFQKQFICDALLSKSNVKTKIYDSRIGGDWEGDYENASSLSLEYYLVVEYKYDQQKQPISFNLNFNGDDISISEGGWYDQGNWGGTMGDAIEPSGDAWFDGFEWGDIDVTLNTEDGDEIEFLAFKHAPPKIQTLFTRHFCETYIESATRLEIRTPEMRDKIQNIPYC